MSTAWLATLVRVCRTPGSASCGRGCQRSVCGPTRVDPRRTVGTPPRATNRCSAAMLIPTIFATLVLHPSVIGANSSPECATSLSSIRLEPGGLIIHSHSHSHSPTASSLLSGPPLSSSSARSPA
jgi:hypothetical protein